MKLLGNRILVKRIEKEEKKSSIILPSSHVDPIFKGEVITVGPGYEDNIGNTHPTVTKPGDKILYTSTSGWHIEHKGEKYTILNERDVLVIIEKEDE